MQPKSTSVNWTCPKCGKSFVVPVFPAVCSCGQTGHDSGTSFPSFTKQAWNLTRSLSAFVGDRCRFVSKDQYKQRLLICDKCGNRVKNRCKKCGCQLAFKAMGRAFVCPEGQWPDAKEENNGMPECVYLMKKVEGKDEVYNCRIHGQCVLTGESTEYPVCRTCKEVTRLTDEDFAAKWIDPLVVTTSSRKRVDTLRGMLAGHPTFLVCGGPSAKSMLPYLNSRGVWSLGVNNAAAHGVRCQAFVHTDPPIKFSHSIWHDPAIMKFVPIPKLCNGRNNIRRKVNGRWEGCGKNIDCPNVWGFQRNSWMTPDENFFMDEGASWGNQNAGQKKTGEQKTVCTMLCGMRLLYYLGSRRIYLVGVDFRMEPGNEYSFNQRKEDDEASDSNNKQFGIVNGWLQRMVNQEVFKKFGLEIYNCYERSGLRAFPHVPFRHALNDVIGDVEQVPDLGGWYEKEDCPKCTSWNVKQKDDRFECLRCEYAWKAGTRPDIPKKERSKYNKELEAQGVPK